MEAGCIGLADCLGLDQTVKGSELCNCGKVSQIWTTLRLGTIGSSARTKSQTSIIQTSIIQSAEKN